MGVCPDPRLRYIYPTIGPQFGRTPIQIYGSSLGKNPHDISVVLTNSNQTKYQCRIQVQSYIIARSFTCQLPSLPTGIYTIQVAVHSVVSQDRPIFHIVVCYSYTVATKIIQQAIILFSLTLYLLSSKSYRARVCICL